MRLRQGMDSKGRIRGYSMSWWGAVLGTKRWKLVCDDMRRQPTPGVLSAVGNARRGNGSPFEFEFVSFEVGVDMDHDSINLRRVWADQTRCFAMGPLRGTGFCVFDARGHGVAPR